MTYRILVDENTSPRVAENLSEKGHEAVHVSQALEAGVDDERIVSYASEHGYVVLTHDNDFLLPAYRDATPILYYSDDTMDASEITDRIDEVIGYVPDQPDLPPITNLSQWS